MTIQGESASAGLPTVFVRCAGCNMNCVYCDTAYARNGGEEMSADLVIDEVEGYTVPRLTITGGEPLLQEEALTLSRTCRDKGYDVQIETNGSIDISVIPAGVRTIMDVKTPGSGMPHMNNISNMGRLRPGDEVKYVITSRDDYIWAADHARKYGLDTREDTVVLFSPASGQIKPRQLAEWILADAHSFIRLQLQLHKQIWPDERGR